MSIRGGSVSDNPNWAADYYVGQRVRVGVGDRNGSLALLRATVVAIAVAGVYLAVPDLGFGSPQDDSEPVPMRVTDPARVKPAAGALWAVAGELGGAAAYTRLE
jgi:hypothetical protein